MKDNLEHVDFDKRGKPWKAIEEAVKAQPDRMDTIKRLRELLTCLTVEQEIARSPKGKEYLWE